MACADGPLNILSPQGLSQRTLRWFAAIYKWSTIPHIHGTRRRVFQETLGTGNPGMFSMTRRVYRFVANGKKVFIAS